MSIVYFLVLNYFLLLIFTLGRKRRGKLDVSQSKFVQVAPLTLLRTLVYPLGVNNYASTESTNHKTCAHSHAHTRSHITRWQRTHRQTATAASVRISAVAGGWRGSDCPPLFAIPIPFWIAAAFPRDLRDKLWSWSQIHEILARPTPTEPLTSLRTLTTTDTNFNIHINLTVFGGWFWLALLYNWNRGSGQIYLECSQSGRR